MTKTSETDMAYAAGFFDGEGTIDIRYRQTHRGAYERFELRIQVAQIDVEVLTYLQSLWGGIVDQYGGTKCSRWILVASHAAQFLSDVLPYLRVKRSQAFVAIEFQHTFNEKQVSLGKAGFARVSPEVRDKRLECFLKLRSIRKEANVSPSGNRDPLSSEKAICGLSYKKAEMGDNCSASSGGEDGSVH